MPAPVWNALFPDGPLPNLLTIVFPLSGLKGAAPGLITVACPVSRNSYILGFTAVVLVVNTFYRITGNLQSCFRRLEQVLEAASSVFVKTCAAGFVCLAGSAPVHGDVPLAAAVIRIVHTVFYATFQLCHDVSLLRFLKKIILSNL